MQIEAHDRGGCVRLHVEPISFHCEDGEQITVWMVSLGRAWASITRCPEIRAGLQGASRQVAAGTTCALRKLTHIGRNIDYQPVPETRASGGVGIVAGNSEALRSWRRV